MHVVPVTLPLPEVARLAPTAHLCLDDETGEGRIVALIPSAAWPSVLERLHPADRARVRLWLRERSVLTSPPPQDRPALRVI